LSHEIILRRRSRLKSNKVEAALMSVAVKYWGEKEKGSKLALQDKGKRDK